MEIIEQLIEQLTKLDPDTIEVSAHGPEERYFAPPAAACSSSSTTT